MLGFLLPLLAKLTIAQIVAAIPQAIQIGKSGIALYETLTDAGNVQHEKALAQAIGLSAKAVIHLVGNLVGVVIPEQHAMTMAEQITWADHFGAGSQS